MEQQEMRRQQKEQAERERLRQESERRREREEEDALDKVRKNVVDQPGCSSGMTTSSRTEEVKAIADTDSSSPSHSSTQDKSAAERERQRLREQERRRREAVRIYFHSFLSSILIKRQKKTTFTALKVLVNKIEDSCDD